MGGVAEEGEGEGEGVDPAALRFEAEMASLEGMAPSEAATTCDLNASLSEEAGQVPARNRTGVLFSLLLFASSHGGPPSSLFFPFPVFLPSSFTLARARSA